MNEIWKRITSESPTFFKKIMALGLTLGGVGAAIMLIPEVSPSIQIPEFLMKLSGYFVAIGAVATAIAKTTVADPTVLKKDDAVK